MLKKIILVGFITLFISCKVSYTPRNIESISIQEFVIDSTSIRAIQVIDSDNLYFAGSKGTTGYTTDGGKNWSIHRISYQDSIIPSFRSIAKSKNDIYTLSIENPALLYRITDNKPELIYIENHPKVFYDSMHFFDDLTGIAIGDPTDDCMSIIITKDGGNSWEKLACKIIPKAIKGEAAFAASNTNIKIIGNTVWMVSGGKVSRVYKSTDKGKTWAVFDTPIIQGKESQGIYSIDFYDKDNGIVIGGDYVKPNENKKNKAITTDGGKTWQLVADEKEPGYKSCIQYVPNTEGKEIFAVGYTGISFSNDGGFTWKK